jgi:signal transduction histidine kinase
MKRPTEPGLIKLFRYFAVIGVLYFFARWVYEMSLNENQIIITQVTIFLLVHALLLVYLLITWLERQMKEYYLPFILVVYTVAMALGSMAYLYVPDRTIIGFITSSFGLVPILIVPLVFIAWQYDYKHVLVYTVFTNIADLAIAMLIVKRVTIENLPMLSMPVIRGFAFMMVGFVVSQLSGNSRRQKHRLLLANMQMSQYSNTLEHLATSRERNRLARELHDTTAHTLSGISVNLEALKTIAPKNNPEMTEMIESSLSAARTGLSETRRALHDLRAQPLEDLGLELALKQLVDSAIERADLKAMVDIDSPLHLPPNVEQVFYRVAQEALENTARHANASTIKIDLSLLDDRLMLSVQDDGQGFNEKEINFDEHFGMKGMRERALTIGADLLIESEPGKGTRLQLSWERFS